MVVQKYRHLIYRKNKSVKRNEKSLNVNFKNYYFSIIQKKLAKDLFDNFIFLLTNKI